MADRVVPPSETLNANGVTLRRWGTGDASALRAAVRASAAHLSPWMPWATPGYGRDEAVDYLARSQRNWEAGEEFNYAIISGSRVVGSIGLMARIGPGGLEIGYWVDVRHVGRGIASRAAAAATAAGLAVPGVDHIEIHHDEANTASGAIPRKLGFRQVDRRAEPERDSTDVVWRLWAAELPQSRVPDLLGQRRY
jgi:ribosomal-protein-serine acetyltransferase